MNRTIYTRVSWLDLHGTRAIVKYGVTHARKTLKGATSMLMRRHPKAVSWEASFEPIADLSLHQRGSTQYGVTPESVGITT